MPSSAPLRLVEFSHSALKANLDLLLERDVDAVIDVRFDAYGHGSDWVEDMARAMGFVSFLTDDEPEHRPLSSSELVYGITEGSRVAVVHAEVVSRKSIPAGDSVSYGYTWTAERQTELALISLGFADGLPRSGSNSCSMTAGNTTSRVVGRIAMDQCVLDVTDGPVSIGDVVTVWDSLGSVQEWAHASKRDPLSLVANLSWRVERRWGE